MGNVQAATFDDPTWPCQQRKVQELSIGLMWNQALPDGFDLDARRPLPSQAQDLVALLSLRRVSLAEAEDAVKSFSEDTEFADPQTMLFIFAEIFTTLGKTRRDIINGIEQYSMKQIALSERIETTRSEMRDIEETTDPDFDRIDRLEEQLDWDERVFRDRTRSLTYVCETPVLIEKRLYAIAQLLLKYAR
ncbi:hypothetical protein [Roseibium sp.]|uniref:hypothetical protein n=1 Tax=Roseibium sp. TaxID=1936156 RepID=UPI003BAC038D